MCLGYMEVRVVTLKQPQGKSNQGQTKKEPERTKNWAPSPNIHNERYILEFQWSARPS
jgi:hypothetical protein